ncbi:HNH endonuclease [Bacillus nitratireducens]|uniref:HNH endonuclease n=1 Tax=Bacillus nitratireducens TaxID=2026193 RepID=A0ABU6P666_9BACI|nr:HNH endonuclease [Bacillus nitratireducens]
MNYFLVFQNKSYVEERSGGYLWAPQTNKFGHTIHHWEDMKKVKKGDIIFNSYKGQLVSVLIARENCNEHDRPTALDQLELWEKKGWMVNVEYINLNVPIIYKDYMGGILELQDDKYAPFNKSGRGNTGYLFRVSTELANFLFNLIEKKNGYTRDKFQIEDKGEEQLIKNFEKDIDSPIVLEETERELIIKSRIGQSAFKKALLAIERKCRLCGVTDERFLIASHIKPWSQSNNQERLDVNNGLLLCPNHDALFDKGYISFDKDGSILISDSLDEATKIFLNINGIINIRMNESQREYMKWHRENVYKN